METLAALDGRNMVDAAAKLHHIAFVVPSIPEAAARLTRSLGGVWDEKIFHEPVQTVWASFISRLTPGEPLLELIQPVDAKSRVAAFLRRGGGLHHFCYEVQDVDAEVGHAASLGSIVVQKPVPGIVFGGRRIAWAYSRDRLLLEFLEREKCPAATS